MMRVRQILGLGLVLLALVGCGGGGGTNEHTNVSPHSLRVHVTGLDGSLILANGDDVLALSEDGEYVLSDQLAKGTSYNIIVASQPEPQTCAVMDPAGNVSGDGDVINIFVNCAELAPLAIILEADETSTLNTITPDAVIFSTLPARLAGVAPGDVIFSEQTMTAPDGLLRKVISINVVNGETVIETEDGALTDIIQNGGFSYKGNISAQWASANPQGIQISPFITMMSASTSAENYCSGKPSDFVLKFKDQPITQDISISGCTGFNLDLDAGGKISKFGKLEAFHFIVDSTVSQALSVSVNASANTADKFSIEYDVFQKALGGEKIKFPAPIPIGPIVIPAGVEVDLFVSLSGSVDASATVGAGAAMTMRAGARLSDSGLQIIGQFNPDFEVIGPELAGNLQFRAAIGPEIAYIIAGAAGPELAFSTPFLQLTSDTADNPWWTLDVGTNAVLALTAELKKIKGFGWVSDKWAIDYQLGTIYEVSRTIAQAQGPYGGSNAAPTANFNFSPASPTAGQTVTFTNLSTDPDGDTLTSYWFFGHGTGATSTTTNPTHVYSTAGEYQVTLEVTDPSGATGVSTKSLSVAPATGGTTYSLTISKPGTGTGTVISDPSGISCGSSCYATFATFTNGTPVTLTAIPDSGSTFTGWSGACSGSDTACSITMSQAQNAVATFDQQSGGGGDLIENRYRILGSDGGIVEDVLTGLQWMRCSMGQTWNASNQTCAGLDDMFTSDDVKSLGANFDGYSDWRLPDIEELQSIIYCSSGIPDYFSGPLQCGGNYASPTILHSVFNNTGFWGYYSSSVVDDGLYMVDFGTGITFTSPGFGVASVRMVRDESSLGGGGTTDTVTSPTGRVWMDRNLGASRVATAYNDSAAYGDLYQWGRGADGHEKRTSPTTTTLSSSDTPGHGSFITTSSSPNDWRNARNNNLWQGVSGVNNPCPSGFRLPTEAEWQAERLTWSTNNRAGAFASPLKLVSAGYRSFVGGSINSAGSEGFYWSSSVDASYSRYLYFGNDYANTYNDDRAYGDSVRCIAD